MSCLKFPLQIVRGVILEKPAELLIPPKKELIKNDFLKHKQKKNLQVNTFERIDSVCTFRDSLSFPIKSSSLSRQLGRFFFLFLILCYYANSLRL